MTSPTETPTAPDRAEPEPLRSEEFARATLDGLSTHIAILDGEGTILAVNAAWREFAGANSPVSGAFAEGANYLRVCDRANGDCAEEADAAAAGIRAVLSGERELFSLEYPCHAPHQPRWFNMRVTRFPGGGPARVVISHEDITPRKLAEESLRRRVEELDQFAYITSHDLKAPLRGIANLSRWIEEDLGESLTPEVSGQLEMLRGRVGRMEAMIEGILQYSRIGRQAITPETVDVRALLTEVIDLLAPPPGIAITLDPNMPALRTTRIPLQQVFQNLLSNAVKHHDKSEGRIHVGVQQRGEWYEFSVRDDGPGIAPKYHGKIFVIFQTLQARDKVENTGVGLALVRKIVEGVGGRVWIESEEGHGATFRFTWPAQPGGECV